MWTNVLVERGVRGEEMGVVRGGRGVGRRRTKGARMGREESVGLSLGIYQPHSDEVGNKQHGRTLNNDEKGRVIPS